MDTIASMHHRIGKYQHDKRYKKAWTEKEKKLVPVRRKDIERWRPLNNYVMLQIPRNDVDFVKLMLGGLEMDMTTRYNETDWAPTYCKVVALPDEVRMDWGDGRVDMEWETEIELVLGDHVISRYLPIMESLGMGDYKGACRAFQDEDKNIYVMVLYQDLICRLRDEGAGMSVSKDVFSPMGITEGSDLEDTYKMYPLNGWVITEPIQDEMTKNMLLDIPKDRNSTNIGRIVHLGKPVTKYRHEVYSHDDGSQLKEGYLAVFTHKGDSKLMVGYLNRLGVDFRRIPRRHLLAQFVREDGSAMTEQEVFA